MRILLAVDGSKNSLDAVQFLIDHVDWYRETPQLELVTVHLPVPKLPGMGAAAPGAGAAPPGAGAGPPGAGAATGAMAFLVAGAAAGAVLDAAGAGPA